MRHILFNSAVKTMVPFFSIALLLSACDRQVQFGSKIEQSAGNPGVECTPLDPAFSVPSAVQQDQNFTMAFQRDTNVVWILKKGATTLTFQGATVTTSLHELGDWLGSVTGVDNCGNSDFFEFSLRVAEPIKGLSITINNNDLFTKTTNVGLQLSATGANQMYVTNDPQCSGGGSWESFKASRTWTLGHRNQLTHVFVKFKNADVESPCISDDITEDDLPPVAAFATTPPALSNSSTANFDFNVTDNLSGVKSIYCKIDQKPFQICGAHKTFSSLADGQHTVSLYADDNAGNASQPIDFTFNIDTVAPSVRITQHPDDPTNKSLAHFEFVGEDNGQPINYFECSLDGAPFVQCPSPKEYQITRDGRHTFKVKGRDNAHNYSQEASFSWTVDTQGPTVIITQKPVDPSKDHDTTFAFTVTDAGVGVKSVQCQIDSNALVDCTSPVSYNLPNGQHTFKVVATDLVDNTGSANYTWMINDKIHDQDIPITDDNGKADIMFVVNNSSSMFGLLRDSIPYRFQNFVSKLGSTDYKAMIITSDATGDREFQSGRLNKILYRAVPASGLALVPYQYSITPMMDNASRNLLATIMRPEAICVQTGTHLCPNPAHGYQEAIHATLKSIERPDTLTELRDDATFNLVIISDNDEGNGNLVDRQGNILPGTPAYNQPQTIISSIQQKWPQKQFKVHGVYQAPGDRGPGCTASSSVRVAHIYDKLVKATGGVHANICNDSNRAEVEAIAQAIQRAPSVFQLSCVPVDTNGDGKPDVTATFDPQPPTSIQTIVNGNAVTFNPMPPAGTTVHLRYTCP